MSSDLTSRLDRRANCRSILRKSEKNQNCFHFYFTDWRGLMSFRWWIDSDFPLKKTNLGRRNEMGKHVDSGVSSGNIRLLLISPWLLTGFPACIQTHCGVSAWMLTLRKSYWWKWGLETCNNITPNKHSIQSVTSKEYQYHIGSPAAAID